MFKHIEIFHLEKCLFFLNISRLTMLTLIGNCIFVSKFTRVLWWDVGKRFLKKKKKSKPNKKYFVGEYLKCSCIKSVCTRFLVRRGCYWECIHITDPKTNRKSRGYVLANLSRRDFTESHGVVPVCFKNHFYPSRFSAWPCEAEFQGQHLKTANILELTKARFFFFPKKSRKQGLMV